MTGPRVGSHRGPKIAGLRTERALPRDARADDVRYDQFYTHPEVALECLDWLRDEFDLQPFQMVEPSAGTGSFLKVLPSDSWGFDIDPKLEGIRKANFLQVDLRADRPIIVMGNPPFGKNAGMAVRFVNHAARTSDKIGMILPATFRKASIQNRLDRNLHLVRDEVIRANAFLFRSCPYDVPAVFQIWERRAVQRELVCVERRHPDFDFTTPLAADFVLQRVGATAGRLHGDRTVSSSSHYFIKDNTICVDVRDVMERLDFASVTRNVAGNPSLAKSEVVALYRAYLER